MMTALSRTPLAAAVCPSAPLLAPRLLRISASLAVFHPPWSLPPASPRYFASGAAKLRKNPIHPKPTEYTIRPDVDELQYQKFRDSCSPPTVLTMMALYPTVVGAGILSRWDTLKLAQVIHTCIRNKSLSAASATDLYSFLDLLVHDLQTGVLPPHYFAFVHILGIYKETCKFEDGHALWQWLVTQDNNFLSQEVYGAAIELLALGRIQPLRELEDLYSDALKRFPGTFAEYHLSPNAILADRSQPHNIHGLPVMLLQGIMTARLIAKDWKGAYLALDTGLRLYPTQLPHRFFEIFLQERPIWEAYTVCLLACRGGIVLKTNHVTLILSKLKSAMRSTPSLQEKITLLRAMVNAIYAYLEAGGSLSPVHIGALLSSLDSMLPTLPVGQDYIGDHAIIRNRVATFGHQTLSTLIQAGMHPSSNPLIALVHLAGHLRLPDLLTVTLADMATAGIELDNIGLRTALTSAGFLGDKKKIEEFWTRLASSAEKGGYQIHGSSWTVLVKACRRAGHLDYFDQQMSSFEHAIPEGYEPKLSLMKEFEAQSTPDIVLMDDAEFHSQFEKLDKQVSDIAAVLMSGQPIDLRKSPFYMAVDPEQQPLGSPQDMRIVYDEFSLDPHQPPASPGKVDPALSPTGVPLDELRFQNWTALTELMYQAESFESLVESDTEQEETASSRKEYSHAHLFRGRQPMPLDELRHVIQGLRSADTTYKPPVRKIAPSNKKISAKPKVRLVSSSKPPALNYYVSLASDHVAPAVTKPKRTHNQVLHSHPAPDTAMEQVQEGRSEEQHGDGAARS